MVTPIDSLQRRPYEPFVIGYFGPIPENIINEYKETRILSSVPGKHSRKPPLECKYVTRDFRLSIS